MPRLAIAREFLSGYAKLEKSVRSSVDAAIAKFNDASGRKGLNLETVSNARDSRVRTIRIDQSWRGVVLAPESGNEFCLLAVLPHDEAYRYAAGRTFSVNQALGVLDMRDQAALDEITPALRSVADTNDDRLYDRVSDSDLTRLGVDAAVLPIVRLLASEKHLDALGPLLPQAQFDALVALASGMTPEEAWAEISDRVVEPATHVDPDDLVGAMERTPGEIAFVSNGDELARILAHPFEVWRTFLHPSQRKIAYRPSYAGPVQVSGGAGTGKTVTALHRAYHLARQVDSSDERPILLTTFTRNLSQSLAGQLELLADDVETFERIEVLNVDRLAHRVVARAIGHQPSVINDAELRAEWDAAARADGVPFSGAFLVEEWEHVILAHAITDEATYLDTPRPGRGVRLGREQRRTAWSAIAELVRRMRANDRWTHLQIDDEAAQILEESNTCPYRHVVVDEAQDLHPAQWRLLRAVVRPGPDDLFVVGDPHQRIYDNHVALSQVGINVRGRSKRLKISYRTTQQILAWTVPLLGSAPTEGLDGEPDVLDGYHAPRNGRRPVARSFENSSDELAALVGQVRKWLDDGVEPHAIGIAARLTSLVKQVSAELAATGIPVVSLTATGSPGSVRVGTMHKMKGLEFGSVAVIGVTDGVIPLAKAVTAESDDSIAHAHDLQRERCLLFVACTRARDNLYVSHTGISSRFLL